MSGPEVIADPTPTYEGNAVNFRTPHDWEKQKKNDDVLLSGDPSSPDYMAQVTSTGTHRMYEYGPDGKKHIVSNDKVLEDWGYTDRKGHERWKQTSQAGVAVLEAAFGSPGALELALGNPKGRKMIEVYLKSAEGKQAVNERLGDNALGEGELGSIANQVFNTLRNRESDQASEANGFIGDVKGRIKALQGRLSRLSARKSESVKPGQNQEAQESKSSKVWAKTGIGIIAVSETILPKRLVETLNEGRLSSEIGHKAFNTWERIKQSRNDILFARDKMRAIRDNTLDQFKEWVDQQRGSSEGASTEEKRRKIKKAIFIGAGAIAGAMALGTAAYLARKGINNFSGETIYGNGFDSSSVPTGTETYDGSLVENPFSGSESSVADAGSVPDLTGGGDSANDGSTSGAESSGVRELGQEFQVEKGHGLSHEIQQYAAKNSIPMSDGEAYRIYQELLKDPSISGDMIDLLGRGNDTYTMANGDIGISAPGTAVWPEEVERALRARLGLP